jgi:hypothetical protein
MNWPSLNYAVVVVLWQSGRQATQGGRRSWTRSTERLTDLESAYKDDDDDGYQTSYLLVGSRCFFFLCLFANWRKMSVF